MRSIPVDPLTLPATIHQPRSDIWKLADNVTLLAKGGTVAYSGRRVDAIPYFTSIGYPMPTEFFNPADHLLDIVSVDPRPATHDASAERVHKMSELWDASTRKETGDEWPSPSRPRSQSESESFQREGARARAAGTPAAQIHSGSHTTPMRIALPVVLERHWKNVSRQVMVMANRFTQGPFVGAMFIFFFQRLNHGPSGELKQTVRC